MARDRANINTNIWTDTHYRSLTRDQQWLYELLLTHPELSYAGVADWRPGRIAQFSAGTSRQDVELIGAELQAERFIVIDEDTEEVLIRSFTRHDGLLKQPRLTVSMVNAYGAIASNSIREVFVHELVRLFGQYPDLKAFENDKVLALLKLPARPMEAFTQGFTPELTLALTPAVTLPFTPNVGQGLALPTTTATTTSTEDKSSTRPASPDAEFDQWYSAYPRKIDKGHARTAFKAARKKTNLETLMAGVRRFEAESRGTDPKFLAYPATWLNGERWEDETPTQTVVTGPWSKDFHKNGTQA